MAEVIAHGGYREATVERVLEQAHVGWSDFTREFGDLDSCFLAALDAGFACAAGAAHDAALEAGPAGVESAFDAALGAVLEAMSEHPALTRLCLVDSAALGVRAVERKEAGLQRFVALLTDGRGAELSPIAAEMVAGGIYEVLQRKARAHELDDLPGLADDLRRLWLPVLRARQPR